MNWLIIHNLLSYNQHSNMIGCRLREHGIPKPRFSQFADIKKGDRIVYYATKDMVVVGIFKVVSSIKYIPDDPFWKEIMIFEIDPFSMPPEGYYLDFKKFVLNRKVQLDLFPNKERWASYLQGRTCRPLTEKDFKNIRRALSDKKYLIKVKKST